MTTAKGNPLDLITVGESPSQIWLIGRQHPGETMASWWMESAIETLCQPERKALLEAATWTIVPMANPDGTMLGNQRTNAYGVDFNRQWAESNPTRCPETISILKAMEETGVDFLFDVHGDTTVPYVFIDTDDETNGSNERLSRAQTIFLEKLEKYRLIFTQSFATQDMTVQCRKIFLFTSPRAALRPCPSL